MKLKMTEDGKGAVVQEGKPVYVTDDGKEVAFDAPGTVATISRLNGEAKGHRERAETAEAKLKAFNGIDDAEAAKKALGIVKNLDEKKLVDAGKVEEVKAAAIKATEEKYAPIVQKAEKLEKDLYNEMIGGAFARSKFISDKLAIPSDLVQARFGSQFEIKDGKIVAKDANGNPIYSRGKPGEIADFDEALGIIVDAYPQKDSILKGKSGGGTGVSTKDGSAGGGKTITRAEFDTLSPMAQMAKMREGVAVAD